MPGRILPGAQRGARALSLITDIGERFEGMHRKNQRMGVSDRAIQNVIGSLIAQVSHLGQRGRGRSGLCDAYVEAPMLYL